jgi:hypothetical protein
MGNKWHALCVGTSRFHQSPPSPSPPNTEAFTCDFVGFVVRMVRLADKMAVRNFVGDADRLTEALQAFEASLPTDVRLGRNQVCVICSCLF